MNDILNKLKANLHIESDSRPGSVLFRRQLKIAQEKYYFIDKCEYAIFI